MSGCKTDEAKEFYMRLCIANGYGKRELERQIDCMLYE
jgi:predicted nuclease of restriction endonuclease-like (RecB) superfamily